MHIKRSTLKNVHMHEGLSDFCSICNFKNILKECECSQFHGKFMCIASIANTWPLLHLCGKHWRTWEERIKAKHSFPDGRKQMELSVIHSITTSPCCKTPQISSSSQNCMGLVSKYREGTRHPAGANSEDMAGFPDQSCWILARVADFPICLAGKKQDELFFPAERGGGQEKQQCDKHPSSELTGRASCRCSIRAH